MALPIGSESRTRGIPTTYKGTRFRSRLEGRWAAFFDLIGWSWIYEPFDTGDWIPDFLITGASPLLVEVGPCEFWSDFSAKAAKPLAAYPPLNVYCERVGHDSCGHDDDYVVSNAPERTTLVLGIFPVINNNAGNAAGLLTSDGSWAETAEALWGRCPNCREFCVTHANGIYRHWPCGHYTGGDTGDDAPETTLFRLWNQASTPVQWRGRR